METNIPKRLLALLMTVLMIFSAVSLTAFAQDEAQTEPEQSTDAPAVDEPADAGDEDEFTGVASSEELENALASGAAKICITADFELDRTFYITRDVTVYSVQKHTLTRKADFAGDIFVVGEAADGTVCPEKVTLNVGTAGTDKSDMLIIDGNKANMTVTVTGTVFFVCKNGQADLHPDLTVTNCEKKGNARALDKKHTLCGDRHIIGGAVAIIAEAHKEDPKSIADGEINVYGGKYTNNSLVSYTYPVLDENGDPVLDKNGEPDTASGNLHGGVFFNHGKLVVYDGLYENNEAASRAAVFYNYRLMYIYKAVVKNNTAKSSGGAIYLPSSSGAKLYIGGNVRTADPQVIFENNSGSYGGAIYSSGTLVARNTVFEGNASTEAGGAIYGTGEYDNISVYNSSFVKNEAGTNGGAIYVKDKRDSVNVELHVRDTQFAENAAGKSGGAVYLYNSTRAYVRDTVFSKNSASSNGGAVYVYGANAEFNYVSFSENTANTGGAAYLNQATVEGVVVPAAVVMNQVAATGNTASGKGGVAYLENANILAYESTFKQNIADGGSAFCFYPSAQGAFYNCLIEENKCPDDYKGNAGAFFLNTSETKVLVHSSTFKNNSSNGLGGAILVTGKSSLDLFNVTATGNEAWRGGFMYETTAGTVVTVSGLTVSGNKINGEKHDDDLSGGPIIWGNTANAKLYINKNNYTDSDATPPLDAAYWTAAIANKLTVSGSDAAVPDYEDYVQPEFDIKNHIGAEHTHEAVVTAPTCTQDGYTTYTCACGDAYIDKIDALGHDNVAFEAKAPTCSEIGWDAYVSCSRGDYTTYVELPALNHKDTLVQVDAQTPDCDSIGWDAYEYCTACDYTTYVELPALNHKDTLVQVAAQAPDCDSIGWDAYEYCTACDYTTYVELPALNHKDTLVQVAAQAPDCDSIGWDAYEYCTACDYTTYVEIPENGHTAGEVVKENEFASTCAKEGSYDNVVSCSVCGEELSRETITVDKLGHIAGEEVIENNVAPDCENNGSYDKVVYCSECTAEMSRATVTVDALGHSMKEIAAVSATCTKNGNVAYYDCSRCDYKSSDSAGKKAITDVSVKAKGHSYKTTVKTEATITKNGQTVEKCSCGAVKSKSEKTIYYPKTIKLSATSYTYNGKAQTPFVTVKDSKGNTLKKDTDYTVKYASGRKSTGKYSVTITFKGKYSGTKTLYFNILPSKTSKITPACSTTEIKASWKSVTGASGYKVELLNSKGKVVKSVTTTKTSYTFKKLSKVTTYKIRVTAYKTIDKKAVYSSVSTTITTSTAPAKVTLSKVTAGSKTATPAWKTVSGASGYQVQYSTSSKFKSAKTATVSKGSSKKTTIKKLTKGKKYYFKVRAYKTVGSVKVYGAWSTVKSVKVK